MLKYLPYQSISTHNTGPTWQENPVGDAFEDPPQSFSWTEWTGCAANGFFHKQLHGLCERKRNTLLNAAIIS